jgi:hypothetical protein
MMNTQKLQRLVIATAFASGLLSVGVAASAQTTAAPVNPTTVSVPTIAMSTADPKAKTQALLNAINADERRSEFRFLGTSL